MSQIFIDRARSEQVYRDGPIPVVREEAEENIREMYPEAFEAFLRVADLADVLESEAESVGVSGTVTRDETKIEIAARIRAALEARQP